MPLGRHFLWVCLLAAGCTNDSNLGGPCPNPDGGPTGARAPEAGTTGGSSGSGGVASGGGSSTSTGGAARGGTAGNGASGNGGADGGGGGAGNGGTRDAGGAATGGTDGGGSGGTTVGNGGAGAAAGTTGGGGTDADASSTASGGTGTGTGGARGNAGAPSYCTDREHDGDETDVDCGGSCAGCGPGNICRTDADCGDVTAGCGDRCYCDTATSTCVYNDCYDNKTDALETDFDCGGPLCHPCDLGAKCLADTDCLSLACDAIVHECVADQCQDHQIDGKESDIDCGGPCAACGPGQKCLTSFDCVAAHFCNTSKVCF